MQVPSTNDQEQALQPVSPTTKIMCVCAQMPSTNDQEQAYLVALRDAALAAVSQAQLLQVSGVANWQP